MDAHQGGSLIQVSPCALAKRIQGLGEDRFRQEIPSWRKKKTTRFKTRSDWKPPQRRETGPRESARRTQNSGGEKKETAHSAQRGRSEKKMDTNNHPNRKMGRRQKPLTKVVWSSQEHGKKKNARASGVIVPRKEARHIKARGRSGDSARNSRRSTKSARNNKNDGDATPKCTMYGGRPGSIPIPRRSEGLLQGWEP